MVRKGEDAMGKGRWIFGIAWRVLGIVFGLFMVFMTLRGLYLIHGDMQDFGKRSLRAAGVVEQRVRRYVPDVGMRNDYIIRFETREGEEITYRERTLLDLKLRVGQRVRVRYMPDNPSYAMVDSGRQDQSTVVNYVMLTAIALGFLTASVVLLVNLLRFTKRSTAEEPAE